jgi:hypothetical protein
VVASETSVQERRGSRGTCRDADVARIERTNKLRYLEDAVRKEKAPTADGFICIGNLMTAANAVLGL